MKKRSYKTELQAAIRKLEEEQEVKLQLVKVNFHQAYENIHPKKLLQNTLNEISSTPYLVDGLISASVGLAAGYITKLSVTGGSTSKFKRFLGVVMQFGITNLIAQNPRAIKAFGQYVSRQISYKEK